jgi:DNA mismatch endonuclease, patch repair protein
MLRAAKVPTKHEMRSRLMGRVRRSGTAPELDLRRSLHRAGYRYRLDGGRGLPGTPDLVFRKLRVAIFVDGCFWHGCRLHGTMPKTNTAFWKAKIIRNQKRDRKVDRSLRELGWIVVRVWEHQLKGELETVVSRVQEVLRHQNVRC